MLQQRLLLAMVIGMWCARRKLVVVVLVLLLLAVARGCCLNIFPMRLCVRAVIDS